MNKRMEQRSSTGKVYRSDGAETSQNSHRSTSITVLTSVSGKRATKRFTPNGVEGYARESRWRWREIEIGTFEDLALLLSEIEADPLSLVVQGTVAPEWRDKTIIPRTKKKGTPSLTDKGSRATHFDIDKLDLPHGTGWHDPEGVARAVWRDQIVAKIPAFKGVSFWWQASSSAGTPGNEHLAKLHLWALIDRPIDEDQRKALLKLAGTDDSLASINQPNYVARPIFEQVPDPLAGVPRSGVVRGVKDHAEIDEIDFPQEEIRKAKARKTTGSVVQIAPPSDLGHATTEAGRKILGRACDQIRCLPRGGRNIEINRIAYTIGGHVAGGAIAFTEAQNALLSAGLASGHTRYAEAVTNGLRDGIQRPLIATETVQLPKAATLTSGRRTDLEKALQDATGPDVLPMAVAVLHRMEWSMPVVYSVADVLDLIETHAGDKLSQPEKDALRDRLTWLQERRRKAVLSRTTLHRRVSRRHTRIEVTSLDEIDITALSGVVLVKGPMGSGKTQRIGRPFVEHAKRMGCSVMAIAHRVSLIAELSARLGLPNYQIVTEGEIEDAGGVAVCLPSTARTDIRKAMPGADFVFIDEIAQVLRFLADSKTCSAGEADNQAIYQRLMQIVRDAQAAVVADADLDMRTLRFLEKARPSDCFTVVEMAATPNGKTATVYHKMARVYDDITIELQDGGKVWCACEGEQRAAQIARLFEQRGFKVICITAKTKGDPAVAAFLQNAEEQSRLYDLVVSSPAISSGLSIEHKGNPHFTLGAFLGAGTAIRPEDARQQLARVRYLTRYSVAIERTNATGGQSVEGHRRGTEAAAALEGLEISWTGFDEYVAGIKAEDANAKADFGAGMWFGMEASGWTVERGDSDDHKATEKALKDARAEYTESRIAALIAAEPMDTHLADMARTMLNRPPELETRLEAHRIRLALGKLDLTEEDIVFWDGGRGAEKIARFEDLVGADVDVAEEHGTLMQRRFRRARRTGFAAMFDGFDLHQVFTRDDQNTLLDRIMADPALHATTGVVGPKYRARYRGKDGRITPLKRPQHPAREVRDMLVRCGLQTVRKRSRSVPKPDFLLNKKDGLGTKTDREYIVAVAPESMAFMQDILDRRAVFDIDRALAERAGHAAPDTTTSLERPTEAVVVPHAEMHWQRAVNTALAENKRLRTEARQRRAAARVHARPPSAAGHGGSPIRRTGTDDIVVVVPEPHRTPAQRRQRRLIVLPEPDQLDAIHALHSPLSHYRIDEDIRRTWCAVTAKAVQEVFAEHACDLSPYDPEAWR